MSLNTALHTLLTHSFFTHKFIMLVNSNDDFSKDLMVQNNYRARRGFVDERWLYGVDRSRPVASLLKQRSHQGWAGMASAECATIEAPKVLIGVRSREGCPLPSRTNWRIWGAS